MADTSFGANGWTPERLGDLSGKTYVVTGGNAGTGFQAVSILLSKGASVVMLNRSVEKSEAAVKELQETFGDEAKIRFIRMDLADLESVRAASRALLDSTDQIDALICNAAIAQVPKQAFTVDGFESQLGTNHYGHFVLCGMLFERVEQSNGRIVVVSSLGYNMGIKTIQFDDMNWDKNYHQNRTYCHSKLAQMMFAYELQDRIAAAGRNLAVFVCHPGASRTSLIETNADMKTRVMFWFMAKLPFVQSAKEGSYPEVMCATEDGLEARALYGPTGMLQCSGPVGKGTLHPHAYEKSVMTKLWDLSEKATNFTWDL